jgi:glycosyltransferase involved in cell wall biosynthesis
VWLDVKRRVRLLLVHQNFPGQFRQLTPLLLARGHDVVAVGSHQRQLPFPCRILRYQEPSKPPQPLPYGAGLWHEALLRAEAVAHLCEGLDSEGWRPDRILGHCGWGETLGLDALWPGVPQILWPEIWVRPEHGGYGSDPQKPSPALPHHLEQLGRNAITRSALAHASHWVLPTRHQASSLPPEYQDHRLHVIHEGIDTTVACPNPQVAFQVRGICIDRSVPTLTLINRNLERLRGFDVFMRALPAVLAAQPQLRVLIVGGNEAGYGGGHHPVPLRQRMLSELGGQLDLERVHFLGRIPYNQLLAVMQASWVHVYLSYPFVLSWSLLEAMACGCAIVGSRGMPVEEVITHGVNGLLIHHDHPEELADRVLKLLAMPEMRERLGAAARTKALEYDQRRTLLQLAQLIEAA